MDQKDLTPEERLLRLIRKGKFKKEPKKEQKEAPGFKPAQDAKVSVSGTGLVFKIADSAVVEGGNLKLFKWLEYGLIAVFCLLTAYLIFDISKKGKLGFSTADLVAKEASDFNIPALELGPFSDYSKVFSKRNLFVWKPTPEVEGQVSAEDLSNALANLTLMGVVEGISQQAIIFDKSSQKTYFLEVGDTLGDFKVEFINSGKVTLNYKGEQVELFL